MKFWEVFFSTDKIIYPLGTTIAFGVFIKILSLLTNTELKDEVIISFMFIGFILGNIVKTNKIIEQHEITMKKDARIISSTLKKNRKDKGF